LQRGTLSRRIGRGSHGAGKWRGGVASKPALLQRTGAGPPAAGMVDSRFATRLLKQADMFRTRIAIPRLTVGRAMSPDMSGVLQEPETV